MLRPAPVRRRSVGPLRDPVVLVRGPRRSRRGEGRAGV